MSNRIFTWSNYKSAQVVQHFIQQWREVCDKQGETKATIGIIQLVLDRLKLFSRNTIAPMDYTLPRQLDLDTFDMDEFISARTKSTTFNQEDLEQELKIDGSNLAELIIRLMRNSHTNPKWLKHFQSFLCSMFRNNEATLLVIKTIIRLYTHAAVLQNDANYSTIFQNQMKQTSQYLSIAIEETTNLSSDAMRIVIDTLFNQINRKPHIIKNDPDGLIRIITKCLSYSCYTYEQYDIKIEAIKGIIRCGNIIYHGNNMLRICANETIVCELTSIITGCEIIKLKELALELAGQIQRVVRDRNVFEITVFQDCVRSDNERLQKLFAELCRAMARRSNNNTANPVEVIISIVTFYQRFCIDYKKCAKRLTNTYFDEFTNWCAVFKAIQMYLNETEFIDIIFYLLKHVIDSVRKDKTKERADNRVRSFLHKSIDFMQILDGKYVRVFGNIIHIIEYADKDLMYISYRHSLVLAEVVENKFMNYFNDFTHQMNVVSIFKILCQKSYLNDRVILTKFQELQRGQNGLDFQTNIDFDADPNVIRTFMSLSVLARQQSIPINVAALLCHKTNNWVMNYRSNLNLEQSQHRILLAYNLIILVECYIIAYTDAAIQINVAKIIDCLCGLLIKTQNELDFLCIAIFWCLSILDLRFNNITHKANGIELLSKHILQKIKLVSLNARDINQAHLKYMEYILMEIKLLIVAKRDIDMPKIVANIYINLPEENFADDLLRFCAKIQDFEMLAKCVINTLKEIALMKDKWKFLKSIEAIVKTEPNSNIIWEKIVNIGNKEFGTEAQAQHGRVWIMKAEATIKILKKFQQQ